VGKCWEEIEEKYRGDDMAFCVAPGCLQPQNDDDQEVCLSCGSKLMLGGRYLPMEMLGQGGFGKTFLAIDQQIPSRPQCVVKQLYISNFPRETIGKAKNLFYQEAEHLDSLGNHLQIPRLLASFQQEENFYLIQEFIEGQTLFDLFAQGGEFTEAQIQDLLTKILPVLKFIHEQNIIHRDIKPGNIILRTIDKLPFLIDFGIAKAMVTVGNTQIGTIIGTMDYMPPEQTYGKVFPASDLYSLGLTCLYLLTGERAADMFDVMEEKWLWKQYLPVGQQVSDRLTQVLNKLVSRKLNERYQSAQEVIDDLQLSPVVNINNPLPLTSKYLGNMAGVRGRSSPVEESNAMDDLAANYSIQKPIFSSGINCSNLKVLLLKKKWQEADVETWKLLRKSIDKLVGDYLSMSDLDKIPAEDLYRIDELWSTYSQKKFGFTIQSLIYEDMDGDYTKFCQKIGWLPYVSSILNDGYKFTDQAPRGHLPSRRFISGFEWWRHAEVMAKKLRSCYE
jgi:serine/threonine protein kinase